MSHFRCVLPLAALALVGGLTACGGGSSNSASNVAAAISSQISAAAASDSPTAGPAASGLVTSGSATSSLVSSSSAAPTSPAGSSGVRPDSDESKTLVYLLEAIDPGMGTDANGLISKSVTVCRHILGGDSTSHVNAVIQQQFSNGAYKPQGEQLTAIDLAMTQIFCR